MCFVSPCHVEYHTTITNAEKISGILFKTKSINVPTKIRSLNTFTHYILNRRHWGNEHCFEQTVPKWQDQLQE